MALSCLPSVAVEPTSCEVVEPAPKPGKPPKLEQRKGMVHLPAGEFWMGSPDARSFPDAQPVHKVRLHDFWIDKKEVTNRQFKEFVRATGYKTVAERVPKPEDYPDTPVEQLVPGALVFKCVETHTKDNPYRWWHYIPGANWSHPSGPESSLDGLWDHPVVEIAWEDAAAYAKWAGKRLPTEAEYEYAARGGLDRKPFAWGDQAMPGKVYQANLFQGTFPANNTRADGYAQTAPAGKFPPNRYGLYDMTGNVWEWCSDWYRPDYYVTLVGNKNVGEPSADPTGPDSSFDPKEPSAKKKVQRGGSFLCTDQYCARYMVGSRGKSEISTGCSNVGFRCVSDSPP